jgi:hypothetical protein
MRGSVWHCRVRFMWSFAIHRALWALYQSVRCSATSCYGRVPQCRCMAARRILCCVGFLQYSHGTSASFIPVEYRVQRSALICVREHSTLWSDYLWYVFARVQRRRPFRPTSVRPTRRRARQPYRRRSRRRYRRRFQAVRVPLASNSSSRPLFRTPFAPFRSVPEQCYGTARVRTHARRRVTAVNVRPLRLTAAAAVPRGPEVLQEYFRVPHRYRWCSACVCGEH